MRISATFTLTRLHQFILPAMMTLAISSLASGESMQQQFVRFTPQADRVLQRMSLEEKIGQMMQPDQAFLKEPSDVATFYMGSLLSGGGSGPKDRADYTLKGWTEMVEGYQKQALSTRLAIPLLYGVDAVHGHNNIPGATLFPHQIGMGCTNDPKLEEQVERITAEEVRATAINWVFAPCVTVPQDIRWGRTYEGFSDDPAIVERLAGPAVKGFQEGASGRLSDPLAVAACAKHFIGDGGTQFGTGDPAKGALLDQGDTRCDEATLRRIHLPGYLAALDSGVATIMPSYSSWNGVKCSENKFLLTDLLKKELGFEGFLISDYNAIDQVSPDYKTCVEKCINAGIDMVMMTDGYPKFFTTMEELVQEKKIPMSRVDDAVRRILRVKFAMGLMDKNYSPMADRSLWKSFGSAAHRAVARQAVRESLVVLRNENHVLPLSPTARRILVAGHGADNLGMQCGGWTLSWQGEDNQMVPGGTSILTALQQGAAKGTRITYSEDGSNAEGADVAVLVIGETPYAEFHGDRRDLEISPRDLEAFHRLKAANVPVVVVLLSGRPLILGELATQADGIVAAWLPGSEGGGVADILYGKAQPTGKLSFDWPASMADLPGHTAEANPLFPRGYGLTYEALAK